MERRSSLQLSIFVGGFKEAEVRGLRMSSEPIETFYRAIYSVRVCTSNYVFTTFVTASGSSGEYIHTSTVII